MTTLHRRPVLRWLVPATVAVALAGGGSAIGLLSASAGNQLAPRTASQLLVDVQEARVTGLSGTVVQDADLGLPSLPGVGGSGSSDLTSLVSGSHTLRVWSAGADKTRVALLGSLGESDVIRNGRDVWTWSSKDKTATHLTLPARTAGSDESDRTPADPSMTPQQAADAALKAISPTTKVSTDGTAEVAGRPAYELVLQPREASSLVESVRIAVDGKTHVPLRVQAFARGADKPAFQVGFTSFDPTAPAASVFAFNPPPGTKVTNSTLGDHTDEAAAEKKAAEKKAAEKGAAPEVVGKGWSSVLVADLPASATSATSGKGSSLTGVLQSLPKVTGSWGSGHVLRGTLFSAVLTDDGRVAVGAVAPEALYAVLAR